MSYRGEADRLFACLARQAGDPGLNLNQDGVLMTILNDLPFSFHFNEETDTLFIQVYCGNLKNHDDQEAVLIKALKANHLWRGTAGGVLGLSGDDLTLAYRLTFPLSDEETPDDFLAELLSHLAGAAEWAADLTAQN